MDGEERILQVEAVLELEMKIYREGEYTLIQDVYTPHRQCIPVRQERTLERLLVKNYSKCRVAERTALEEPRGKVLQICHSDGSVKVDSAETVKDGIRVEGIIQVRILYIVSDDDMPFYSVETAVPFSHVVEARGIDDSCRTCLRADLEQLSTSMADSSDIEIKAVLNLNALVLGRMTENIMVSVEEKEVDRKARSAMPGILCYQVQEGDSLWDIARTFCTTMEEISSLNQLEGEELTPGTSLILVKRVEE